MTEKKDKADIIRSSAAEYLTFVAATGDGGFEAVYSDENVWLTQNEHVQEYGTKRIAEAY